MKVVPNHHFSGAMLVSGRGVCWALLDWSQGQGLHNFSIFNQHWNWTTSRLLDQQNGGLEREIFILVVVSNIFPMLTNNNIFLNGLKPPTSSDTNTFHFICVFSLIFLEDYFLDGLGTRRGFRCCCFGFNPPGIGCPLGNWGSIFRINGLVIINLLMKMGYIRVTSHNPFTNHLLTTNQWDIYHGYNPLISPSS